MCMCAMNEHWMWQKWGGSWRHPWDDHKWNLYVLGSIVVVYASFQVGVNLIVVPYVAFSFWMSIKKILFENLFMLE